MFIKVFLKIKKTVATIKNEIPFIMMFIEKLI